jgi:hypothetical protein
MNRDTATAEITPGTRVVFHTHMNWKTFGRLYSTPVALVVAVSPRTLHIRLRRANGTTTLKWVKRNRVTPCQIQDKTQADLYARREIYWT